MAKNNKKPKYQGKPTLESVAARRSQTVVELLAEWGVSNAEQLVNKCAAEGLAPPSAVTLKLLAKQATQTQIVQPKPALFGRKPKPKTDEEP